MISGALFEGLLRNAPASDLEETPPASDKLEPQRLIANLRDEIAWLSDRLGEKPDTDALYRLLRGAEHGLNELATHGDSAQLPRRDVAGLEAVVHANGSRPVMFVEDDFVDLSAPAGLRHAASLARMETELRTVCRAVGRVNDPSAGLGYHGTAWMVDHGLVITNYHVLAAVSVNASRVNGTFHGTVKPGVAIDFGAEIDGGPIGRRFPVTEVVAVGGAGDERFIRSELEDINFDGLDVALLRLGPVLGQSFPKPVNIARQDDPVTKGERASQGRPVLVIGYPGDPRSTRPDIFGALFAGVAGVKRLAPGILTMGRGQVEDNNHNWVLGHDASTLGGSSGSIVMDYASTEGMALGLHFGGVPGTVNWAHATEGLSETFSDVIPRWARDDSRMV